MAIPTHLQSAYYRILGVQPGCSLSDIKQAYREKAKEFHPDINPDPDAPDRFIEVNEAYEYFVRKFNSPRQKIVRDGISTAEMDDILRQWMERERGKARARAARYARQRYEDFRRSPLYRTSSLLSIGANYLILGFGIMMISGSAYGIYNIYSAWKTVTAAGVFAAVMTSLLGMVIMAFSLSDIRRRRKELRRMEDEG
ncbi:MAG: J domain-containing protein [Bacteroidales bacterium]